MFGDIYDGYSEGVKNIKMERMELEKGVENGGSFVGFRNRNEVL